MREGGERGEGMRGVADHGGTTAGELIPSELYHQGGMRMRNYKNIQYVEYGDIQYWKY